MTEVDLQQDELWLITALSISKEYFEGKAKIHFVNDELSYGEGHYCCFKHKKQQWYISRKLLKKAIHNDKSSVPKPQSGVKRTEWKHRCRRRALLKGTNNLSNPIPVESIFPIPPNWEDYVHLTETMSRVNSQIY